MTEIDTDAVYAALDREIREDLARGELWGDLIEIVSEAEWREVYRMIFYHHSHSLIDFWRMKSDELIRREISLRWDTAMARAEERARDEEKARQEARRGVYGPYRAWVDG